MVMVHWLGLAPRVLWVWVVWWSATDQVSRPSTEEALTLVVAVSPLSVVEERRFRRRG